MILAVTEKTPSGTGPLMIWKWLIHQMRSNLRKGQECCKFDIVGGSQLENLSLKSFRWVGPATRGGREPTTDQTDVGCVWSVNPISMRSASTNRLWPSTPVVNSSPVLQYSSSLCFDCFWAIFPPCFRSIDTPLVLLCGGIGKHWICRWFRANTSMILIWH